MVARFCSGGLPSNTYLQRGYSEPFNAWDKTQRARQKKHRRRREQRLHCKGRCATERSEARTRTDLGNTWRQIRTPERRSRHSGQGCLVVLTPLSPHKRGCGEVGSVMFTPTDMFHSRHTVVSTTDFCLGVANNKRAAKEACTRAS